MIVRPATLGDAASVQALWNLAIRETLITFNSVEKSLEEVQTAISTARAFLVAADGDAVLGYASFDQFRGGQGYAHTMEHSIMLAPDARAQGIGRALMAHLEELARTYGAHSLVAGISGSNPLGVPFHEALGFAHVGTMPEAGFKNGRWHDLVFMQRILNTPTKGR